MFDAQQMDKQMNTSEMISEIGLNVTSSEWLMLNYSLILGLVLMAVEKNSYA